MKAHSSLLKTISILLVAALAAAGCQPALAESVFLYGLPFPFLSRFSHAPPACCSRGIENDQGTTVEFEPTTTI